MTPHDDQLDSNSDSAIYLNTTIPNMARVFDYLLGGTANFEADRVAAEQMVQKVPSLRKWVRLRRAFIQEAAQVLRADGFMQFLDLGSGIPASDHIHASVPDAHIVYSDINPVAVSYGASLFADLENVAYIPGNVRQMDALLSSDKVRRLISLDHPVAIGLNALMLFLSPEDCKAAAETLHDWAPAGSRLFVVFQTRQSGDMPDLYDEIMGMAASAGLPMQLYPLEECIDMLSPWRIHRVESLTEFLGLPEDFITEEEREGIEMFFYAAFLEKEQP
ncbi:MAG: SAM-dependent methyltransferase [Anaerolineae bacterium]